MLLPPGTRLGPYEVVGPLGEGGMGDVYRARDTRLDRVVAIKVSKDPFSERSEREARTVAALNHPHICQLYDVGPNYLVMEYVEGLPIHPPDSTQKLLDLAIQIADGLTAAHAAGIVHRDLKPGNILVNRAGQVKILDFGLALLSPAAPGTSDARRTEAVTDQGTTVGTVAYMSPEQARGETVDARTDLWSLGVVLYELSTRVRPFDGATPAVVFGALLDKTPAPVRERDPRVPVELERIILRLLDKDRETRYQSAADVRADLKRVARDSSGRVATAAGHAPGERAPADRRRRSIFLAAGMVALALVVLAGGWAFFHSTALSAPVTSPSEYTQLTNFADSATAPSLSPDGRMVAFIRGGSAFRSRGQIYVKLLPNGESVRLTSSQALKFAPVFSPDGSRVAYTEISTAGTLSWDTWTVPVLGGLPTRFLPNASGLTWTTNAGSSLPRVLFSEIGPGGYHMGIVAATEGRAESRKIYFPGHDRAMAHYSYLSPDHRSVLVIEMDGSGAFQRCRLVPFDGSSAGEQVGPSGKCLSAAWSPDGKLMYFGAVVGGVSHLWRQTFPGGTPEQITFGPTEEEGVAPAPDGRSLVTSVGADQSTIWLHDARGERAVSSEGSASLPRLSSDGTHVYYLLQSGAASPVGELVLADLTSGKLDHLIPGVQLRDYAVSADEKDVAFTTITGGESQIWLAPLDRAAPPRQITRDGDSVSFGRDGELIFRERDAKVNYLARVRTDGSGRERISTAPIFNKYGVSPGGEWVVVVAAATGEAASDETIAIPNRGGAPRKLCRDCTGRWSDDGRFLYLSSIGTTSMASVRTIAIPVAVGASLPELPPSGVDMASGAAGLPGATPIEGSPAAGMSPGPNPSTYVFVKMEQRRNLFRIPLH